ncbi:MAG: excinuclease ABC subunit UvrC [Bacteroidota bacterium]|nr:excinuclease ABC subunit UvrC [Bacteroidota bacterium]
MLFNNKNNPILYSKLSNIPHNPGVYQFLNSDGEVLYVGKAINLKNRVAQYFSSPDRLSPRIAKMISKVADLEITVTDTEVEALILEATLIKKLRPRYNIDLKDDKSYPYIVITNEPLPRLFVTRRLVRDGSKYFGPYTDVKSMRASLKMIREIFKVRSCNYLIDEETIQKRKIKLCLDYHIKKCDGPCEGLISIDRYNSMINDVAQVLKGKTSSLISDLKEKMHRASEEFRFEEAAEIRDRLNQLSVYNERQKVVDTELIDRDIFAIAIDGNDACGMVFIVREGKLIGRRHVIMTAIEDKTEQEILEQFIERYYLDNDDLPGEIVLPCEIENISLIRNWLKKKRDKSIEIIIPQIGEKAKLIRLCKANAQLLLDEIKIQKEKRKDHIAHSVTALQRDLRLAKQPLRIECFDVSNIQGVDNVASLVVFVNGKPRKSEYRKYKIQTVQGANDFASMREVIQRRYQRLIEEKGEFPDLIVVDGGKGQLSSGITVLTELGLKKNHQLPIIAIAKRLEEVFIAGSSEPQTIPKTSSGLKLLQQIRNEAHRFAVTYHRTFRKKRTLQTELELIEGIGKKRAKRLLEIFGSVQDVKSAKFEHIAEIIGKESAGKIQAYFFGKNGWL